MSKINNSKFIKGIITFAIFLIVWLLPSTIFGIPDLTMTEQRVIAIFVLAALLWILEIFPAWVTSVLIIVMLVLTTSDSAFWFLKQNSDVTALGTLVSYKSYVRTFADPIIMLFLGGFVLAIATTKTGIDVQLAKVMLKPFGNKFNNVLLGFILVTAMFSMFISNTATAAMMLAFMAPVLKALPEEGKGKLGLVMAIPIGANIGGIGTPIGTPPNAIALQSLNELPNINIGFGDWVIHMLPIALILLFISWLLLRRLFPSNKKTIELDIKSTNKNEVPRRDKLIVSITFGVTIILWMLDKVIGVNSNVIALIPIAVFCLTGIIGKKELKEINWSVLWMVAGGIALGVGLNETHLAADLINAIPFNTWSVPLIILGSCLICWTLSTFISNTATAALLVPILCAVGVGMEDSLASIGGVTTLLVCVAISASVAMVLPISTPPNALAHSTGLIQQKDMEKVGLIMGTLGLIIGIGMTIGYNLLGIGL
ncbi:MAG: SLC13 family permease [Bacteroidales bacterium]